MSMSLALFSALAFALAGQVTSSDFDSQDFESSIETEFANLTAQIKEASAGLGSSRDVEGLQKKVDAAKAFSKQLENETAIPGCADCAKYFHGEIAKQNIPKAQAMEKTAKLRLRKAAKWAALETQREKALPTLLAAMQTQAKHEHELTVKEGERAKKTEIAQGEFEIQQKAHLKAFQQAVARQRLADRIRAAEDARIGAMAMKKAKGLKVKKVLVEKHVPVAPCVNCEYA